MRLKKCMPTRVKGLLMGVVPITLFYLMEAYEHNPFVEIRPWAQIFNIILFVLLAWVIFCFTGKGRFALRVLTVLSMVFGLVNHYVTLFRSTPFVPWDLFSAKTAFSVAGNYDMTPSLRVIIVTLGFVAILILLHFYKWNMKKMLLVRLGSMGILCLILIFFVGKLQNERFQNQYKLYPFLFTPGYMTKVNGMAVTFAMDLAYINVDKPLGYSQKECQQVLASYEKEETQEKKNDCNIIVIMNEAFSDLSVLGDLQASEDPIPYVHSLMNGAPNTISGYLHVSVCGGNTANTEYEFLTGNSMAFLPAGSIPYQQYIKDETPSLASHLKELGYETYAMHPFQASGWCRDKVYPLLGFDNSYFINDMSARDYMRKYVSDLSDMKNIISIYEKKDADKPMFLFNVTMQNHGGYTDSYENFSSDIHVDGANNAALDQYLSLIHKSDQALEYLTDYFQNEKEPTMIVFFGDHQPNATVARSVMTANTKESDRYEVPFVIWANFDIEEKSQVNTSPNYLAPIMLQAAGIRTNGYENFLLDLQKKYPVISTMDTQVAAEDKNLYNMYQKLAYYVLFTR